MSVDLSTAVFLDTNILVYAFDRSAGSKHRLAAELVRGCWESQNGCLSIQVLQEFYVTVTRKLAEPFDRVSAQRLVADLGMWRVHSPSVADLLQAITLQERYQISLWDAMVLHSAATSGCTMLYSEDLNSGQFYGEVQVINPFLALPRQSVNEVSGRY